MIASSNWEVLGFGRSSVVDEGGGGSLAQEMESAAATREDDWVVTYFAATPFTPSGVDVYCRNRKGLEERVVEVTKKGMGESGGEEVRKLTEGLFEVSRPAM